MTTKAIMSALVPLAFLLGTAVRPDPAPAPRPRESGLPIEELVAIDDRAVVGADPVAPAPATVHPFASDDPGIAREAVDDYIRKGASSIPELRRLLASHDVRVKRRAKEALARITGQWGNDGRGIRWCRSVDEIPAERRSLPIVHLQLFGNLDEEFC